jgi:hypothetical protein
VKVINIIAEGKKGGNNVLEKQSKENRQGRGV